MDVLPNLAGIATQGLVEKIGAGTFQAAYINWSRTMHMLREHAPGWLPELVRTTEGGMLHRAPAGAYLLIRFRHLDGTVTPEVPQAIMDTRNAAVPLEKITARDITDTHRRGVCMAAAFTFGLAYELWAKMPLESGHAERPKDDDEPELTKISEAQRGEIVDLLQACGKAVEGFCAHYGIAKVADLPAARFDAVTAPLRKKAA